MLDIPIPVNNPLPRYRFPENQPHEMWHKKRKQEQKYINLSMEIFSSYSDPPLIHSHSSFGNLFGQSNKRL